MAHHGEDTCPSDHVPSLFPNYILLLKPCQTFCSLMVFFVVFFNILRLVHGPNLRSVVWECVRENDLFLAGTCHWSRYIKGLSSTSMQRYLEVRISQHWYTHALIIKSCHLASCFVGHMLFAPTSLWLLHCISLCHNCLGHDEQFRTHWYENKEPSLNGFTVFDIMFHLS